MGVSGSLRRNRGERHRQREAEARGEAQWRGANTAHSANVSLQPFEDLFPFLWECPRAVLLEQALLGRPAHGLAVASAFQHPHRAATSGCTVSRKAVSGLPHPPSGPPRPACPTGASPAAGAAGSPSWALCSPEGRALAYFCALVLPSCMVRGEPWGRDYLLLRSRVCV